MKYITGSESETIKIGKKIANKLKAGDIILLRGNLGAGKTVLAKGILEYFGIKNVVSPTFTLMQIYKNKPIQKNISILAHIDTYRVKNEKELVEIGIEDYLGEENTICLIEWPEKMDILFKPFSFPDTFSLTESPAFSQPPL